ncbi:MAG: extracellular solute-binding protein [Paenibacillaceae bacterium]|nr:extracellular solute-binding protein [Paenibacillaceae bacterium]
MRIVIEQATDNFEAMRAFKSDEPPDLMDSGGWALFHRQGLFIDLTSYVEEERLADELNAGVMRIARTDGRLPGLPIEVSVPLIMINKRLFDRADLPYPGEDWAWDYFAELAGKLTMRDADGIVRQCGYGTGIDIEHFQPYVFRNGGRYVAPDGSTARGYVDSEETIEAIGKMVALYRVQRGAVMAGTEPCEFSWPNDIAIHYAYTWQAADFIGRGLADDFMPVGLPRMPGGEKSNMIYMGGVGVTTKSPNPRLAWQFARHYVLERPDRFIQPRDLPVTRSQAVLSGMAEHPIWSRYLQELDDVVASGHSEKWSSSRQLINEELIRMIRNGTDVRQLMKGWTRFA